MSKKIESLESHFEREYVKNYTRRRHTHELINKVFTVHISIFLAVVASAGFFFDIDPESDFKEKVVLVSFFVGAILAGIIFFVAIINLHIARDYYRGREKILYNGLELCSRSKGDKKSKKSLKELENLLERYNQFSRYDLRSWSPSYKGLFTLFRFCIYISNSILVLLITFSSISTSESLTLIVGLMVMSAMFGVQYFIGKRYSTIYLNTYVNGSDRPGFLGA